MIALALSGGRRDGGVQSYAAHTAVRAAHSAAGLGRRRLDRIIGLANLKLAQVKFYRITSNLHGSRAWSLGQRLWYCVN